MTNLQANPPHRARAMTFLEVVVAVALLALLASTVFGAFNFMLGRQRIEQQTLAAHEVANRLVLSYLDDRNAMPSSNLPIEYGPDRYRWEYHVDRVNIITPDPVNPDTAPRPVPSRDRVPFNERIRLLTVRVWLGEESGGSFSPDPGVPHAKLTRLLYPLANRNPDSFDNMIKSDTGIRGYMDEILGTDRSAAPAPNRAPGNRRPTSGEGRPAPASAPRATPIPSRLPVVAPRGGS